ncbi:MAG: hypothetical protein COU69_00200 [Candidatus Pacebacteria bacterium CG10_big_fil_rev_8_21_14_0_10_56_10]|nr:MAG: hypothetical protein COU69_00200 [Candidatus Pacebacteria bacterium CG10_big_fil_rev_8_21_14_0_10_56_10]
MDSHLAEKGTKHLAALRLAQLLGLEPDQIVGIGDNHNDYPLLTACGYKVAMGNAPDELKEISDWVAPPYWEDGVAEAIGRLMNQSSTCSLDTTIKGASHTSCS